MTLRLVADTVVAQLGEQTGLPVTRDPDAVTLLLADHPVVVLVGAATVDQVLADGTPMARWSCHAATYGPAGLDATDRLYTAVETLARTSWAPQFTPAPLTLSDDVALPAYQFDVET